MERIENIFKQIILEEEKNNNIELKLVIKEFLELANSYTEDNTIYINKNAIDNVVYNDDIDNKYNYYNLIKNLYHEIRHLIQEHEADTGIINNSSFFYITTNLIDEYYDKDDYKRNYKYVEIELDANIYAYTKLKKYIDNKELLKNIDNRIKELNNLLHNSIRIDKNGNIVKTYNYIPDILDNIIKNNPSILHKYSQLSLFYFSDGTRKGIIDLDINKIIELYKDNDIFFKQMLLKDNDNKVLKELMGDINEEY